MFVLMAVSVLMGQMHIELHSFDLRFVLAGRVQMVSIKAELRELMFQLVKIDTEIQHCADKHVTADAAKNIEEKCFHCSVVFDLN